MNRRSLSLLHSISIPIGTGWLLGQCMEARGKQDLLLTQRPETLEALRTQALIQSTESSNRIEGVTVERGRLLPLVLQNARPTDRSEEELVGYRKALNWVFKDADKIAISPKSIQKIHSLAQGGSTGDAGKWKEKDNEIIEILPNGERLVRFKAVTAKETPAAISRLCLDYLDASEKEMLPPLLAIGMTVFDFLCIHPFRDGNGRSSRILTTLLLEQQGFKIGRYISLERVIEETKEDYYRVLKDSSHHWHQGKHDIFPWLNYFLSTVKIAYKELDTRISAADPVGGKSDLIRQIVLSHSSTFTVKEIKAACPNVSEQLIKKVLQDLQKEKLIKLSGHGRGARWHVV
jgi:Fic family protein